uniref:Uncharacterized protein n=1 Tax=Timema bartmani TaxID=61472 RepID=A0A7R9I1W7_9NEOP|nr:unnamed protein product [Timema bartmani]
METYRQTLTLKRVHPTEIRTLISPSSVVELNKTSALANYATEAAVSYYPFSRSKPFPGVTTQRRGMIKLFELVKLVGYLPKVYASYLPRAGRVEDKERKKERRIREWTSEYSPVGCRRPLSPPAPRNERSHQSTRREALQGDASRTFNKTWRCNLWGDNHRPPPSRVTSANLTAAVFGVLLKVWGEWGVEGVGMYSGEPLLVSLWDHNDALRTQDGCQLSEQRPTSLFWSLETLEKSSGLESERTPTSGHANDDLDGGASIKMAEYSERHGTNSKSVVENRLEWRSFVAAP